MLGPKIRCRRHGCPRSRIQGRTNIESQWSNFIPEYVENLPLRIAPHRLLLSCNYRHVRNRWRPTTCYPISIVYWMVNRKNLVYLIPSSLDWNLTTNHDAIVTVNVTVRNHDKPFIVLQVEYIVNNIDSWTESIVRAHRITAGREVGGLVQGRPKFVKRIYIILCVYRYRWISGVRPCMTCWP